MSDTQMTVSMSGMLRNAAYALDAFAKLLDEHDGEEEFDSMNMEHQPASAAFMLRECIRHLSETRKGEHSVAEFLKFYSIEGKP